MIEKRSKMNLEGLIRTVDPIPVTGQCGCKLLEHGNKEAEQFYRSLTGQQVRVGIESTGGTRWLERLWAELGFELWIGDAAGIRAAAAHKQKYR